MKDREIKDMACIAVAVSFDQRLSSLLRVAERLALRTGAQLKLIHVCDSWNQSILAAGSGHRVDGVQDALEIEQQFVAEQRLRRLIDGSMSPTIKVESIVLFGEVVPNIIRAISDMHADLVLIAATTDDRGDLIQGTSKATMLAQDAPIPVLVVNQTVSPAILDHTLRILIADNLAPEGRAALDCAMSFARVIGGASLLHAHVNTRQEIKSLSEKIRNNSTGSFAPQEQAKDCFVQQRRDIANALQDRAAFWLSALDGTGSEYQTEVLTGGVSEQLHQAANAHLSDLIVFGQHLMVHRGQGMSGGQMTYKTMFAQHRLVLVVPTAPLLSSC
jgi:nucleotide-binding universal stress UspA family protein